MAELGGQNTGRDEEHAAEEAARHGDAWKPLNFLTWCSKVLLKVLRCTSNQRPFGSIVRSDREVLQSQHSMVLQSPHITIADIRRATGNFSSTFIIGQGSYSIVHKGVLRDGTQVAVKSEKKVNNSCDLTALKIQVELLERLQHKNLVKLYACFDHEEDRIYVLEFIPNGNLREHLDGKYERYLRFSSRLDIAVDVARALAYLHEYPVFPLMHGKLRSTNVLITTNNRAKLTDYGFAMNDEYSDSSQVISTTWAPGSMPPEYYHFGTLTLQGDVYTFGVLLLELFSGRHTVEKWREKKEWLLINWAKAKHLEDKPYAIMDPQCTPHEEARKALKGVLALAVSCLEEMPESRPNMRTCQDGIEKIRNNYLDVASTIRNWDH